MINKVVSSIENLITVKSDNRGCITASNSIHFIEEVSIPPVCLVLTQYISKLGKNLSYNIYIINNIKYDICSVNLRDILPSGVRFVSTYVENGRYECCKDKILYYIPIIKSNSVCKIILNVCPITLGRKINSIEVLGKKSQCTIHNPSKACTVVYLKQKKKCKVAYAF